MLKACYIASSDILQLDHNVCYATCQASYFKVLKPVKFQQLRIYLQTP